MILLRFIHNQVKDVLCCKSMDYSVVENASIQLVTTEDSFISF